MRYTYIHKEICVLYKHTEGNMCVIHVCVICICSRRPEVDVGYFLTQSLPVASEIRFLTKYEAHRFGYAGQPMSLRNPAVPTTPHFQATVTCENLSSEICVKML